MGWGVGIGSGMMSDEGEAGCMWVECVQTDCLVKETT